MYSEVAWFTMIISRRRSDEYHYINGWKLHSETPDIKPLKL